MRLKGKLRELMVRDGREWRGTVDRVVFNFPHVGGKSKDVNRQVRYNQGMYLLIPFRSFSSSYIKFQKFITSTSQSHN